MKLRNLKCSLAVKQGDQPNCPATLMCGGLLRARSAIENPTHPGRAQQKDTIFKKENKGAKSKNPPEHMA